LYKVSNLELLTNDVNGKP